jgi:hypothetical protein
MRRTPEEQSLARLLQHPYGDTVEELAREESFVTRSMFGCVVGVEPTPRRRRLTSSASRRSRRGSGR